MIKITLAIRYKAWKNNIEKSITDKRLSQICTRPYSYIRTNDTMQLYPTSKTNRK